MIEARFIQHRYVFIELVRENVKHEDRAACLALLVRADIPLVLCNYLFKAAATSDIDFIVVAVG